METLVENGMRLVVTTHYSTVYLFEMRVGLAVMSDTALSNVNCCADKVAPCL